MRSKAMLLSITLMITSFVAFGQNVEKTLVKSFNLKGNTEVLVDLDGLVEVETWNKDVMRVQMTIEIPNGNTHMLKSLIQAGRYNLVSREKDGVLLVVAPGMEREIRIKGSELKENIKYLVYAPSDVIVNVRDEASTSIETGNTALK